VSQQVIVHFKGTPANLLTLLASVDIGIDPAHAIQESDGIWRVQMRGANSIPDWGPSTRATSRIDFWLDRVIRSAQTGTAANGDPTYTTVNRGRHITMCVNGPHGSQFRNRLRTAFAASGTTENHDSPQQLLNFFGATVRKTRVAFDVRLIALSPPDSWDPEDPSNSALMTDLYTPLQFPHHRFA
tara:strand:+ start:12358 stop:12912 length:555 start_codon:yes stop_codon:yes gene_type:complete